MMEPHAIRITKQTFEQIYTDYFEVVSRFLNYYTHDLYAIEEVVQEVFVKLWEDSSGKEIEYIKTYLYCSARNRMLNYLRNNENRALILEKWAQVELENNQSEDCPDNDQLVLLLQAAVDSLPPKCREIFVLSREEQLTYKEIARIKDLSVKTVENQLGIALKKIREYVLSHPDHPALLLFLLVPSV